MLLYSFAKCEVENPTCVKRVMVRSCISKLGNRPPQSIVTHADACIAVAATMVFLGVTTKTFSR